MFWVAKTKISHIVFYEFLLFIWNYCGHEKIAKLLCKQRIVYSSYYVTNNTIILKGFHENKNKPIRLIFRQIG